MLNALLEEDSPRTRMITASYLISAVLFILSLGGLSKEATSRRGNFLGMAGMFIAIVSTFFLPAFGDQWMYFGLAFGLGGGLGLFIAYSVEMIQMPQMVAGLHSFVGVAATTVAFSNYFFNLGNPSSKVRDVETYIGICIGGITFSGSVMAFVKFMGWGGRYMAGPVLLCGKGRHMLNMLVAGGVLVSGVLFGIDDKEPLYLYINLGLSMFLGLHMIIAVGAADMPVIVSMLNSYSGWTTAAGGFLLDNNLLIITGALVGSSGAILSYIMCTAVNRKFLNVLLGGFGGESNMAPPQQDIKGKQVHCTDSTEVADLIDQAKNIIITPGYGMAASRAQFVVAQLVKVLRKMGKNVRFCIHPVAGRLPGHMNVLLMEARVPYNIVEEMEKINDEFAKTDLVFVIGANDTCNPDSSNPGSQIFGMPTCRVWEAKWTITLKRTITSSGFSGIANSLFYMENNKMYLGDAKAKVEELLEKIAERAGEIRPSYQPVSLKEEKEEKKETVVELEESPSPKVELVKSLGVPKEHLVDECRVAMAPSRVKGFLNLGFRVKVERGAGVKAGWKDIEYTHVGALVCDCHDVWNSDIVLKINTPMLNHDLKQHEKLLIRPNSALFCYLYPEKNNELYYELKSKEVKVFALDCIPRITRAQKFDTQSSMTNITGYRAMLEGFNYFPRYSKGQITPAGKIDPARVFVNGVGVAGLAAIHVAIGLGAEVHAFDGREAAREQAESLGAHPIQLDLEEDASGVGGYAKEPSPAMKKAQEKMMFFQVPWADIVITTANVPGQKAPKLISKEMVQKMRSGSVIVDLAAANGGNCTLTRPGKLFVEPNSGVTIVGYTDWPSRMAQQSSELFSTNILNLFKDLCGITVTAKGNNAKHFGFNKEDLVVDQALVVDETGCRHIPYGERVKMAETKAKEVDAAAIEKGMPAAKAKSFKDLLTMNSPTKGDHLDTRKNSLLNLRKLEKDEKAEHLLNRSLSETSVELPEQHGDAGNINPLRNSVGIVCGLVAFIAMAYGTSIGFIISLMAFVLSICVGFLVIWNVTPALHTPLMSVTNAISGIIVIGAMLQLYSPTGLVTHNILGLSGLFFASINVCGGFLVTQKILNMFQLG